MQHLRFPEALRRMREKRQVSRQEISDKLGVSVTSIYRREMPGSNLKASTIAEYLDALGATFEEFSRAVLDLHGTEEPSDDDDLQLILKIFKAVKRAQQ